MGGAGVRVAARALVWAVCTAGFLYQASDVLQLYGRHAFTVTVYKEHGSQHIRFPAITVPHSRCTDRRHSARLPFNQGLLHMHWALRARSQEPPEALEERLLFNAGLRSEAAYAPEELFKCHMRSMDDKCAAFSCTPMIRRTFYRAPSFMCYTFDLYQYAEARHPFRMCEVPWLYELELTAEWDPRETGPTDHVWKYPLIVHEAEVCPPEKLAPIHLRLGMRYTVSISQRSFRRLPYPSASRCTDYRTRGRVDAYFGYMNYEVCLQDCSIQRELEKCGCALPEHEFAAAAFNGAPCTKESRPTATALFGCKPSRDILLFCMQMRRNAVRWALRMIRSSFTAIVRFAANSQTVYYYHRRLSGQEALAYVGGYIGMWLGVSLYSIYVGLETWLGAFLRSRWHVFTQPQHVRTQ
ncbi:uncharacterized protein LOC144095243 [Amblyomma americanum]